MNVNIVADLEMLLVVDFYMTIGVCLTLQRN
jgi:hypothetical protein